MRNKLLIVLLMSIFLVSLISAVDYPEEFLKKRQITNLSNYSIVQFNVSYDPDMNADFSDVRFLNDNESIFLNYWLEDVVNSDHVRVRVQTNGASSVYLYYKNSSKTSESSIYDIFGNGLISFWRFENNSNDYLGVNNLTATGVPTLTNAEFGKGYYFDGSDDAFFIANSSFPNGSAGRTFYIDALLNTSGASDCGMMGLGSDQGTPRIFFQLVPQPNAQSINFAGWGDDGDIGDYVQNTYTSFMVSYGNASSLIYGLVNGTNTNKTLGGFMDLSNRDFDIMKYTHTSTFCQGIVDEAGVWSDNLSGQDLYKLYDMSKVISVTGNEQDNIAPSILIGLNSPTNASTLTNSNVSFNCSVSSSLVIQNITLFINGLANYTITDGVNNDADLFTSLNLSDGNYNYTCIATDVINTIGTTDTYIFSVDTTIPPVEEETNGNIIYNVFAGAGAGIALFITYIAIPLFILLTALFLIFGVFYNIIVQLVPKLREALRM